MTQSADKTAAILEQAFPGAVLRDVSLAAVSRWRVGGTADIVVQPESVDQLCQLRALLTTQGIASTTIGATTNLLFADEGLRAVAIHIGEAFDTLSIDGPEISVGAGVWVPALARAAMQAGLSGIEHICGIPGTLGGLVCMNGGSQRRGIGEAIVEVTSVDAHGNVRTRNREECGFAYRRSVFQDADEIITGARLALDPPDDRLAKRSGIRRAMIKIMSDRRQKFPHHTPNCGSVFVSNPAMYADHGPPGAVIERLGFKGTRRGGAEVSPLHANFIVNKDGARAADILSLITTIRTAVQEATGYEMAVEARYVRPDGVMVPAFGMPTSDSSAEMARNP